MSLCSQSERLRAMEVISPFENIFLRESSWSSADFVLDEVIGSEFLQGKIGTRNRLLEVEARFVACTGHRGNEFLDSKYFRKSHGPTITKFQKVQAYVRRLVAYFIDGGYISSALCQYCTNCRAAQLAH